MLNFNYCNPTRILFGRDEHRKIGTHLKAQGFERALIVYGSGSALKNGTIAAVLVLAFLLYMLFRPYKESNTLKVKVKTKKANA